MYVYIRVRVCDIGLYILHIKNINYEMLIMLTQYFK